MDKEDDYRRYAAEAQELSDRALNQADKEWWLRIAQSWMMLIKRHAPTADQSFDSETEAKDTHQKRSNESH